MLFARAGMNHRVDEHVLLQQAAGIGGDDANGRGARVGIHEGTDVGDRAAEVAVEGWIGFLHASPLLTEGRSRSKMWPCTQTVETSLIWKQTVWPA